MVPTKRTAISDSMSDCERSSLGHVAEAGGFLTQTVKRIPLDLADPLTTQLEFVCYLFQGPGSPVVQSEPK